MKSFLYTLFLGFLFHTASAQILITEIMYNPPESGQDSLEYLELYNNSDAPVDLTGWTFSEGLTFTFPNMTMQPGEYLTLCVNEVAFKNIYGDNIAVLQWEARALVNGGELLEISDAEGNVITSVDYKSGSGGWYTEADGNGTSIELCNFEGNPNNKENWRPSENSLGVVINENEMFGTPGSENSTSCSLAPDHIVEVGSFFFAPADITIQPGEVVQWVNIGGTHNINGTQATFPDNPESFGNGSPSSGWTYEFTFTIPGVYNYQCDPHSSQMQGTVTVEGDVNPELPLYSIGVLRSIDDQGVADSIGVSCAIIGITHGINIRPDGQGLQFTLIDSNGDGIGIFSPANDFGYTLQEGDELRIEGTVEQFRGLLQMNVSDLELLSTGNDTASPMTVNDLNEETENRLIKLEGLTVVDPSQWTNNPGGFNVTVTNGTNNYEMRIARNVETFMEAPEGIFNLVGIGGQFSSTSAPFLDGYQILPRYAADFDFGTSTQESRQMQVKVYPNPASYELIVESNDMIGLCEIFDLSGKLVFRQPTVGDKNVLMVDNFPTGSYIMRLYSAGSMEIIRVVITR